MRQSLLLIGLCLFFFLPQTHAQYSGAKDGIGVRYIGLDYQYPVISSLDNDNFTYGIEIEYMRYLNEFLSVTAPLKLAKADLPVNEMGRTSDATVFSLDLLLRMQYFKEPVFVNPFVFSGVGMVFEDMEDFGMAAPIGFGLNFRMGRHFYLSTKAEYRFAFDDLRSNVQLGAGIVALLGTGTTSEPQVENTDTDMDGIVDAEDLCPNIAGTAALNGCPDADNDGIADASDECPTVAGTAAFNGCPDTDGDGIADKDDNCPDKAGLAENGGCPVEDADEDGVPDDADECPTEPGTMATNGCPDSDGDGVIDRDDSCPNEAGAAAMNGCPDSDGDGFADPDDACPTVPGIEANKGCPELVKEVITDVAMAATAIQFETGNSTLTTASYPVLDQIVDVLKRYTNYQVSIEGHTDSIGSRDKNQKLSEDRAKACRDYIISKGIDSDRVSYKGYGESQPIANNKYKSGRDQNRRVEFILSLK
jgi:OOP family OmpA-OmpF porin